MQFPAENVLKLRSEIFPFQLEERSRKVSIAAVFRIHIANVQRPRIFFVQTPFQILRLHNNGFEMVKTGKAAHFLTSGPEAPRRIDPCKLQSKLLASRSSKIALELIASSPFL